MFTTTEILIIVALIALPVICSLTMGKNGTFTDTKKIIVVGIIPVIVVIIYFYSRGMDIMSILLDAFGALLLFGAVNGAIIAYFDKMWADQEYTRKELEKQEERNRELREELRNKE